MFVPACMLLESFLYLRHCNLVPVRIPVHKAVAAYRNMGENKRTERDVLLYGTGCANAEDIKTFFLSLRLSCDEIYICQSIQFIHHDVDIVCSYSG